MNKNEQLYADFLEKASKMSTKAVLLALARTKKHFKEKKAMEQKIKEEERMNEDRMTPPTTSGRID